MSTHPPTDLPIQCSCGALQGFVRGTTHDTGNRCICYCDDCQSFAHYLGHADQVLDPHGGTDIFQTSSGRLEITQGIEQLTCLRLTETGMLRWYARCCMAPICNTFPSRQVPFLGLIVDCATAAGDSDTTDEVLGPIVARVNARFAKGDREQLDAYDRAPLSMGFRILSLLVKARLRREHLRSPLFNSTTQKPRVLPHVLTSDVLDSVEIARDKN